MPETPKKDTPKKKVAKKVITVASVVQPEARAARAGLKAKAASAKGAARAGERGAKKAANRKTEAPKRTSPKTESRSKGKTQEHKTPKNPQGNTERPSGRKRAVQYAKRETGRRVQSARTSVRTERTKTASAVRSKYRRDKVTGLAEMRPKTRMLAAEFIAAIVIATILLFVGDKSYHEKMSRFFVQLTGITGIFFFLALLGNSEKAGKWVVPFGLLIDLSMIGFLMKNSGADVITRSLGGIPKNKPGSGEPTPTPHQGGTGGPIRVTSAETYNAPHPGGTGIPGVKTWPNSDQIGAGSGDTVI
jgi:hypothetical protein